MFEYNLAEYFRLSRELVKHHGFSLWEIEKMVPWRLQTYILLINQEIEEEKLKHRENSVR